MTYSTKYHIISYNIYYTIMWYTILYYNEIYYNIIYFHVIYDHIIHVSRTWKQPWAYVILRPSHHFMHHNILRRYIITYIVHQTAHIVLHPAHLSPSHIASYQTLPISPPTLLHISHQPSHIATSRKSHIIHHTSYIIHHPTLLPTESPAERARHAATRVAIVMIKVNLPGYIASGRWDDVPGYITNGKWDDDVRSW